MIETTGFLGLIILLIAYVLNVHGLIKPQSFIYLILNLIGDLFLFLYAIFTGVGPFILLNLIYIIVTCYYLYTFRKIRYRK